MGEFSPDWPHGHQTRDGRKARIICQDAKGSFPIIALVDGKYGEYPRAYSIEGVSSLEPGSIINSPAPKRIFEGWAVWPKGCGGPIITEYKPPGYSDPTLVRIEFPSEV